MHPIGDSVEDEQEHDQLENEWKCLPSPIGIARKRDLACHMCGKDKENLVCGEGCHIGQEHVKILDRTCGPQYSAAKKSRPIPQ
jgi:hypothetical protein